MNTRNDPIKRLGIIGTAGRRSDAANMSIKVFKRMCDAARAVIRLRGYTHMVSGGAAWADHVAVRLALKGDLVTPDRLLLHVPSALNNGRYNDSDRDGGTANHYHKLFSEKTGFDSLAELAEIQRRGATIHVNPLGFKARNTDVARDSHGLLAFTFGDGPAWKAEIHSAATSASAAMLNSAGTGTIDTWNKCRAIEKIHVAVTRLDDTSGPETSRGRPPGTGGATPVPSQQYIPRPPPASASALAPVVSSTRPFIPRRAVRPAEGPEIG